eukprot:6275887-Alexandrium_andersonii.AAC.1
MPDTVEYPAVEPTPAEGGAQDVGVEPERAEEEALPPRAEVAPPSDFQDLDRAGQLPSSDVVVKVANPS